MGSLSCSSSDSQATRCEPWELWVAQALSNVVLPKPADAERRVRACVRAMSRRVSKRSRVIRVAGRQGGESLGRSNVTGNAEEADDASEVDEALICSDNDSVD